MRVFKYPAQVRGIDAKSDLIDEQALALTMAVMTQVHVSRIRYLHALKELRTARDYLAVQQRILDQIHAQESAGRMSEQAVVKEELNTLLAEAKNDIAYANVENAIGTLYLSIGVDPLGADVAPENGCGHACSSSSRCEARHAPPSRTSCSCRRSGHSLVDHRDPLGAAA